MEANRDALGQAYPGEDGIDGGDPLTVGLRVRDVDGAGDAVDVTAHYLIAAHQLDLSRISHPDRSKVRLLEISVEVPAQKGLSSSSQKATNRAMHTAAHRRSPNSSEGTASAAFAKAQFHWSPPRAVGPVWSDASAITLLVPYVCLGPSSSK
jgi:hypothetical protein